jgi:hypothetical protein
MNQRCQTCGAELFEGQQFCRQCGAAVVASSGEATTQLLGDGWTQPQAPESANTSPVRAGTEPVGERQSSPAFQQPTSYQPPLVSFQQTSPLATPPVVRKSRRGLWLVALLAVFLLGAGVAGVGIFAWWRAHRQQVIVVKKGTAGEGVGHPTEIPAPPLPPDFGEQLGKQIGKAVEAARSAGPLDESGAKVSGDETVLTKTFQLDDDATFAVNLSNGDVTVTGSDGDEAEVKITKQGGSAEQRSATRVLLAQTDERLLFMNAGGPSGIKVSYEVKVPRGLHELEISTQMGDVKVSGFDGSVVASVNRGNVEFRDVTGQVKSNVMKGDTRIVYGGAEHEGSQEFSVIKGNIEATLANGTDAEVRAETIAGDIDADDSLGFSVEKRPAGRTLSGRLGDGGQTLHFKVTSGDIKLKK